MRQEDVANQIKFVRKDGVGSVMSRSAYCMYEADAVTMDVDRVAIIAKVLKIAPEYIAYGISDENAVSEVEFTHGEFNATRKWSLNEDWLYERYEAEAADLALVQAPTSTATVAAGDMAVVRLGAKPGASGGEFVFAEGGKVRIAQVSKPSRHAGYVVLNKDGKTQRELDEDNVVFLGKAIGRFG